MIFVKKRIVLAEKFVELYINQDKGANKTKEISELICSLLLVLICYVTGQFCTELTF